jgi:hypothetical protein
MSYTYFIGEDQVTLINLTDGNRVTIYSDDARYEKFKELIILEYYVEAELLDTKKVVENFSTHKVNGFGIEIEDGQGIVNLHGAKYPLANAIVDKILRMHGQGFPVDPLVNFLENLYENPSKTAIDELFLFLEQTELPITKDGCFVAYKIVRKDYMDIYSGTMDNSVGKTVAMPRFSVDDKRENTCSAGLHFCSKNYLSAYGSANQNTDRCVLVKINPADVVSIPSDYNNAKGRTCKYEVIGEIDNDEWRKFLADRDYNESCVVDEDGDEWDEDEEYQGFDELNDDDCWDLIERNNLFYSFADQRWYDVDNNDVSIYHVSDEVDLSVGRLKELIS